MKNVGQSKTGNGVSNTLMLGSRKETVDGKPITVTVLYSRSGKLTGWERFKLFFLGNSLEKEARQKIIQLLTKNPPKSEAGKNLLRQIQASSSGVSASDFIKIVAQEKLFGVDLLEEVKITHRKISLQSSEEISEDYLLMVTNALWRFQGGTSPERITELLARSSNAAPTAMTLQETMDLNSFRSLFSSPLLDVSTKLGSESIIQRIDEVLKPSPQTDQQSTTELSQPLAMPKISEDSLLKEIRQQKTEIHGPATHVTPSASIEKLNKRSKNIDQPINSILNASGQSTSSLVQQNAARKQTTSSDDKFVDVPLDS